MRVGWFERRALKHVYYHIWNRWQIQVRCVKQGTQSRCTSTTQRDGMGREVGGGVQDGGTHVHAWLIHVNVWQKPPQYCKVIILQLNKLILKNKKETNKKSTCHVGNLGLIPGLGRSPGEGKGYLLQYSGLENSVDCIVPGITKSQSQLSDFLFFPVVHYYLTNYAYEIKPPRKPLNDGVCRASKLVNTRRCQQGGTLPFPHTLPPPGCSWVASFIITQQ